MRGREIRRGYARACDQRNNCCRNRALWGRTSLSTHAATLAGRLPPRWGWHSGERRGRANSQPDRCRQPSRTWRRKDSLAQVMRMVVHRARRKTTSVIDTITRQARSACRYLSLRILTIQSCIFAHNPITTAGATLIGARMCVHISFHRICNERGRWSAPLCKISF